MTDAPEARSESTLGASDSLRRRLRWLIIIRLVVISSFFAAYLFFQLQEGVATGAPATGRYDILYFLFGAGYGASILYLALLRLLRSRPEIQAYIQLVGDLLFTTGLVHYYGALTGPSSSLYFLVIIIASGLLRRRAAILIASLAWILYALVVLSAYRGWTQTGPPSDTRTFRVLYDLAAHFVGFYAVAFLTSQLARSATRAEIELERKRADLAALRVVHRDVVESVPSGLITLDEKGVVTSSNPAAREILQLAREDLEGHTVAEIGLFDGEQWLQLSQLSPGESHRRQETTFLRPDGERPIGFDLTTLASSDEAPHGFILVFQDLFDWRKLQEEVRIKDRMAAVGELAAGIAHEIGNPLAALSGSVQMLKSTMEEGSSQRTLLEIINKESERLDRTIKGFLRFARPRDRVATRFDIARLLRDNVELLANSPEVADGHELLVELEPQSAEILADPDLMSQIFWNLARNALRAMPDGGTLTVEGTLQESVYTIRFSDTGRGMSDEERAKLFQPFKSFHDGGTGIGMAIVYRIVQEHGGRLSVDSAPGQGTTIAIEVPVNPPSRGTTR